MILRKTPLKVYSNLKWFLCYILLEDSKLKRIQTLPPPCVFIYGHNGGQNKKNTIHSFCMDYSFNIYQCNFISGMNDQNI